MRIVVLLCCALLIASCTDSPLPSAPEGEAPLLAQRDALPDQYIVVFRSTVADAPGLARALVAAHGGQLHFTYQHAIKGFAATLPAAALEGIRRNPHVAFVEMDAPVELQSTPVTQNNAPWGLDRIDQRALPLSNTFTYRATGQGVRVYIVDSGIRFTHQEFEGRAQRGFDVFDIENPNLSTDGEDCLGHGTHVASTIGGRTYGVAKGATLIAVRVYGCSSSTTNARVAAGVDWVTANHIKPAVVNMSLSGSSLVMDQAVTSSIAAGITYVVAAGNANLDGVEVDACERSPSRVTQTIAVGLTNQLDSRSFGNFGPCIDFFAPGSLILGADHVSDASTTLKSGTSMSTAFGSGVAAQYLQHNPTASPAEVAGALDAVLTRGIVTNAGPNTINNHLLFTPGWFGNDAPSVSITSPANGAAIIAGDPVTFAGSGNDPEDGPLSGSSLVWTSSLDGQIGTGSSFTRADLSLGSHTITLTGSDGQGNTGTAQVSITIGPNQPPVAAFSMNCGNGPTCAFSDLSTDPDGTVTGWSWNFGNGVTSTARNPGTTYTAAGTYLVRLTVTDDRSAQASATRYVRCELQKNGRLRCSELTGAANLPPTAAITAPSNGQGFPTGTTVTFAGTGSDPEDGALTGTSLVWRSSVNGVLGSGTSTSTATLSPGMHTISLTATDTQGATGSASISIRIGDNLAPTAAFSVSCGSGPTCTFTDQSTDPDGTVVGWSWSFGVAGATSTVRHPTFTYTSAGSFTVQLEVTDNAGAKGVANRVVSCEVQKNGRLRCS